MKVPAANEIQSIKNRQLSKKIEEEFRHLIPSSSSPHAPLQGFPQIDALHARLPAGADHLICVGIVMSEPAQPGRLFQWHCVAVQNVHAISPEFKSARKCAPTPSREGAHLFLAKRGHRVRTDAPTVTRTGRQRRCRQQRACVDGWSKLKRYHGPGPGERIRFNRKKTTLS
jgi:hypothetical protein